MMASPHFPADLGLLPTRLTVLETLGKQLRVGIVHARWNTAIIGALVAGAKKSLLASGVREENIVVQDVPGSYELPLAVQRSLIIEPQTPDC